VNPYIPVLTSTRTVRCGAVAVRCCCCCSLLLFAVAVAVRCCCSLLLFAVAVCCCCSLLLSAPASAAGCRPNRGPLRCGERAEEKSEGGRARCAAVRGTYTDVRPANPGARSRTRSTGTVRRARLRGCAFFGYFLCTSKES